MNSQNEKERDVAHVPLVVDLDGTLTPVDTLAESIVRLLVGSPLKILQFPGWLFAGRAFFKARVADRVDFESISIPFRDALILYLNEQVALGRNVILATAANEKIAKVIAARLGIFDRVLASDEDRNLKGSVKLEAIKEAVGPRFVYAGNSAADLPIWNSSAGAILVDVPRGVKRGISTQTFVEKEFCDRQSALGVWARALRIHQWLKNLLLFVPLLTSFSFDDLHKLLAVVLAFVSFSLTASATYLVNDLWDLENDRSHPRKKGRALASGQIQISTALAAASILLATAFIVASQVTISFVLMLVVYLIVTSAYSWALKGYVLVDVLALSALYTIRIFAGSLAIGVPISSWLLVFSLLLFLSLALVKRCSELLALSRIERVAAAGRDYRVGDLVVLWPMGVGASLCSIVVFCLFLSSPETQAKYTMPQLMWIVAFALIYWLSRVWIKTSRHEMHDDPIVFAVRDWGSRTTILAMIALTLGAHFMG